MRHLLVPCPACGSSLRGHPATGYRCLRCHAYYSARHMRAMRREHFRDLVTQHFSDTKKAQRTATDVPKPAPVQQEERVDDEILIEDTTREITHALEEAKAAASAAARHLDDVVGGAEQVAEDRVALVKVAAAMPQLRHEQRPAGYRPKMPSIGARRPSARKKAVKRKTVKMRAPPKARRTVARKKAARRKPARKAVTRRRR